MKKFLIQTINNQIKHDFCFHLIEAIEYNNWYNNEKIYDYVLSETIKEYEGCIPVGSLEFVFEYMNYYHDVSRDKIYPINIPIELHKDEFLKRNVFMSNKKDLTLSKEMFIKSNTQYKKFTEIMNRIDILPDDEYLVSETIDIDSEWRAFIYNNHLVGLKQYSGDFKLFPDVNLIERMINLYHNSPLAYTLDIGINSNGCFLIEIHPFVSCGLYGFNDYRILPHMFIHGFNYMLKNAKEKN